MRSKFLFIVIAAAVVFLVMHNFSAFDDMLNASKMKKSIQEQIAPNWIDSSLGIGSIFVTGVKPSNWVTIDKTAKTYECDMLIKGTYTLGTGDQSIKTPFKVTHKMRVVKSEPYSITLVQ